MFNGTAEMKLAMLVFLYYLVFAKNSVYVDVDAWCQSTSPKRNFCRRLGSAHNELYYSDHKSMVFKKLISENFTPPHIRVNDNTKRASQHCRTPMSRPLRPQKGHYTGTRPRIIFVCVLILS